MKAEFTLKKTTENNTLSSSEKILSLYLNEIGKYPPLTDEEVKNLTIQIHEGCEKSFDKLVRHNLRFVIRVAKKYRNQGVPFIDLIEAGTMGLLYSAKKYIYNEESKFLSYAVHGITHNIQKELSNMSRSFRVPPRVVPKIQDLNKRVLEGEILKGAEVLFYLAMQPSSSLDAPLITNEGEEQNEILMSSISKDTNEGERSAMYGELIGLLVEEVNRLLVDREKKILLKIFGFVDGEEHTMTEVAANLGISRERVRVIKEKALKKLLQSKKIRSYYLENGLSLEDLM